MVNIGTIAAGGGLLLASILLYLIPISQRRSRSDERRAEEAARDWYARIEREDKISDSDHGNF